MNESYSSSYFAILLFYGHGMGLAKLTHMS